MKIEKNVPLPAKFPFAQMQVGDSFAVPDDIRRSAVSIAALRYGRKHGKKFVVKQTAPNGTALRCWRVA